MLYPQNGDRIAAVDFVTSFHPVYLVSLAPGLQDLLREITMKKSADV